MTVRSVCGIILVSEQPERLADFYGSVLDCEFKRENHGGLSEHFGADIGRLHFGIHPPSGFSRARAAGAGAVIAFDVTSLEQTAAALERLNAVRLQAPHDEGFGMVASFLDPDGNTFEIVELSYEFED